MLAPIVGVGGDLGKDKGVADLHGMKDITRRHPFNDIE